MKQDKEFVAITGYYGSGSSAVLALLSEFENMCISKGKGIEYEHVLFYADGGLFDFAEAILHENNPMKSDAAVNAFRDCMNKLYNNDFGWFGSYKVLYGDSFLKITNQYINNLSYMVEGGSNVNHYTHVSTSFMKAVIQLAARIIWKRPIYKLGRQYHYDKKPLYVCLPDQNKFLQETKHFTSNYLELTSGDNAITLYDHLLLPQHHSLLDIYFDNRLKLIIVLRDPRDLYICDKYIWSQKSMYGKRFFPDTPEAFVNYWKKVVVHPYENKHILFLHFEDIVYQKKKVITDLSAFLGIDASAWTQEHKNFDERVSIYNTQVFKSNPEWLKEVAYIEENLTQYLYDFPFESDHKLRRVF